MLHTICVHTVCLYIVCTHTGHRDFVIIGEHFLCRKEVPHLMIVVLFVMKYIVCPIIVGRVLYLLNQEHKR